MFNVGINAANPKCAPKLKAHAKLFCKLWKQFTRLYEECGGFNTIFEWPRSCAYWVLKKVSNLFKKLNMMFTDFDGCQLGLRPAPKDKYKNNPNFLFEEAL